MHHIFWYGLLYLQIVSAKSVQPKVSFVSSIILRNGYYTLLNGKLIIWLALHHMKRNIEGSYRYNLLATKAKWMLLMCIVLRSFISKPSRYFESLKTWPNVHTIFWVEDLQLLPLFQRTNLYLFTVSSLIV